MILRVSLGGSATLRVLICGGRDFDDAAFIYAELDVRLKRSGFSTVIEGVGRGVDQIAGQWARTRGLELLEFPADWANKGRSAGPIRNEQMLRDGKPDLVIAFPGGRGTAHTCTLAEKLGIPIERIVR